MLAYLSRFRMYLGENQVNLSGPGGGPHQRLIWTYDFGGGTNIDVIVTPLFDPNPPF